MHCQAVWAVLKRNNIIVSINGMPATGKITLGMILLRDISPGMFGDSSSWYDMSAAAWPGHILPAPTDMTGLQCTDPLGQIMLTQATAHSMA